MFNGVPCSQDYEELVRNNEQQQREIAELKATKEQLLAYLREHEPECCLRCAATPAHLLTTVTPPYNANMQFEFGAPLTDGAPMSVGHHVTPGINVCATSPAMRDSNTPFQMENEVCVTDNVFGEFYPTVTSYEVKPEHPCTVSVILDDLPNLENLGEIDFLSPISPDVQCGRGSVSDYLDIKD